MRSRIIGRIDPERLDRIAGELPAVDTFPADTTYSEYVIGTWYSIVLVNDSGDPTDTTFRPYSGAWRTTPFGERLPATLSFIRAAFDCSRLRWARLFVVKNGVIVPHRDYTEFDGAYLRLNVPLRTSTRCLHSEEDVVFHQRLGEIWHLDADAVHSACALAGQSRITLCLDFDMDGAPGPYPLRDGSTATPIPPPHVVRRPYVDADMLAALHGLAHVLTRETFRDILAILAKTHFTHDLPAREVHALLGEICRRSGDTTLVELSRRFTSHCIGARRIGEGFRFREAREAE